MELIRVYSSFFHQDLKVHFEDLTNTFLFAPIRILFIFLSELALILILLSAHTHTHTPFSVSALSDALFLEFRAPDGLIVPV